MKRELKAVPHYTREVSGRAVTGLFAVMGNMDSYRDIISPGAFTKTFKEGFGSDGAWKFHHLWQHDFSSPAIAVVKELREVTREEIPQDVLSTYPEITGAALVTREYLKTPRADEVLEGIKSGVKYQMSFGFDAIRYDFGEDEGDGMPMRFLREIRLWETSDVLWGANAATLAAKALQAAIRESRALTKDQVEQLAGEFKRLDDILGGDPALLELKEGRVLSSKNRKLVQEAHDALGALLEQADKDEEGKSAEPPTREPGSSRDDEDHSDVLESVKAFSLLTQEIDLMSELRSFGRVIHAEGGTR